MQSASLRFLICTGPMLVVAGCYSPYQNGPGPYGQPYQPQYPSGPVYTVPPGQPYAPGGTTAPGMGSPTPITPPTYDNSGSGGNAPTYNPNPPSGSSGSNREVPPPTDDLIGPSAIKPTGGLQPTSSQRDNLQSPFEQESNAAPEPPRTISNEPDPFELPDRVSSTRRTSSAVIQNVKYESPVAETRNPFGRDTKHANPEWLRGVVDFDSRERTWQIIYASKPDARDPQGGSISLGQHPDLTLCRTGDIVLVEGAIDSSQTDSRGKPVYVLDKVTPLAAE